MSHTAHPRGPGRLIAAHADEVLRLLGLTHSPELFGSMAGYRRYLAFRHAFGRAMAPVYARPGFAPLAGHELWRERQRLLLADCADLSVPLPRDGGLHPRGIEPFDAPFDMPRDLPAACGWLLVAEGLSQFSPALLARARRLGLDARFGARHLAVAPRAQQAHWRLFSGALERLVLDRDAEWRTSRAFGQALGHTLGLVMRQAAGARA